jgi:hypothetical protein
MFAIDDLVEILKGYLGEELVPPDSKAHKIMVSPQHKGKIGFVIESPLIPQGTPPQEIKFDIRRYI